LRKTPTTVYHRGIAKKTRPKTQGLASKCVVFLLNAVLKSHFESTFIRNLFCADSVPYTVKRKTKQT